MQLGQLEDVFACQHADLVGEAPAVLEVVAEPFGPVVLHVKQVGLVHGVDRERRRRAAALVAALPVAAQVRKRSSTGGAPGFVVELIVVDMIDVELLVVEVIVVEMIVVEIIVVEILGKSR